MLTFDSALSIFFKATYETVSFNASRVCVCFIDPFQYALYLTGDGKKKSMSNRKLNSYRF